MSEWDYSWDYGDEQPYDTWSWDVGRGGGSPWDLSGYGTPNDGTQYSMNINDYTTPSDNWYQETGQNIGGSDPAGGGFWNSVLGGLGAVGGFLGKNAGTLGPLLSGAGGVAGGAIGSNAANDAARLQADALNRGIDLQTAQWLQQQGNLAPYLQAGQGGLAQLQQLAGREQPSLPGAAPGIRSADYNASLPDLMPGWRPQAYQGPQAPDAGAYRWNPQQGPQAQDYRYTPGQTPDAAGYASGPPQLYQGAMPGTPVPTLSGAELLAQDPGAAFRQSEARKAIEGSAAARGDLLSGGTLQALQSRSQDLASQEYQNAWQRMMARDTEQYGRNWGQYQQRWGEGVTGAELGLRTNAQNFGQATAAAQLREQVGQIASQQGWSQAQAEAAFREGQAQLASQQGWNQALQGQQNTYTQGLETSKYNQDQQKTFTDEIYKRMLAQNQLLYGRDVAQNETDYTRQQAAYRQQLAQHLLPFEQQSTLANLGGQAVGMYGNQGQSAANSIATLLGRVGEAQGTGAAGSGLMWNRALTGAAGQVPSLLAGLNA